MKKSLALISSTPKASFTTKSNSLLPSLKHLLISLMSLPSKKLKVSINFARPICWSKTRWTMGKIWPKTVTHSQRSENFSIEFTKGVSRTKSKGWKKLSKSNSRKNGCKLRLRTQSQKLRARKWQSCWTSASWNWAIRSLHFSSEARLRSFYLIFLYFFSSILYLFFSLVPDENLAGRAEDGFTIERKRRWSWI